MPRQRADSRLIVGLTLTLFAAGARSAPAADAGAPPPDAKASRAEATKLFKQKKYAAACERFKAAAAATPDDAALLADLALCQQRLGQDSEATATNLRAISFPPRDGKQIDDPALARVRRHAYFNLDKLGTVLAGGSHVDGSCIELEAAAGCATTFHACAYTATQGWAMRMYDRTLLKLALTEKDAVWTEDERTDQAFDEPGNSGSNPPGETPDRVEGAVSVMTNFEEEGRTHTCEWNEGWSCQRSDVVQSAARACLRAAGLVLKPNESLYDAACFKQQCATLEKKPTKAVLREKRQMEKHVSRCEDEILANSGGTYSCDVVYANACTGLVATACAPGESKRDRKPAVEISEYRVVRGK